MICHDDELQSELSYLQGVFEYPPALVRNCLRKTKKSVEIPTLTTGTTPPTGGEPTEGNELKVLSLP